MNITRIAHLFMAPMAELGDDKFLAHGSEMGTDMGNDMGGGAVGHIGAHLIDADG